MEQLEQEVKLEVPETWAPPDLDGVIPGSRVSPLPTLDMEATYYDTTDLRLARNRVTLRLRTEAELGAPRRPKEAVSVWTLKLPPPRDMAEDAGLLSRRELTWPSPLPSRAANHPRRPHPEPANAVRALALGQPLVPVANVRTRRERVAVLTSDRRHLAEVDYDRVEGRRLLGDYRPSQFWEVEVELAGGSSVEVLRAVVARLSDAGARPSPRVSKLKTVLGRDAEPGPVPTDKPPAVMADALKQQAWACLSALWEHDPLVRLRAPSPEPVHKARVAVRRFRALLRGFRRRLQDNGHAAPSATAWLDTLDTNLRWFSHVLGNARDADVRLAGLRQQCHRLPSADSAGAVALVQAGSNDRDDAYAKLFEALTGDLYLEVLLGLAGLAGVAGTTSARSGPAARAAVPPALWDCLTSGARAGMLQMAKQQWRSLRKEVRRLGNPPSDEGLHRVRVKAKRLRYVAEVTAPLLGDKTLQRAALGTIATATELQDLLGDLHDDVVNDTWLRRASAADPAAALAAGQLLAWARAQQDELRSAWTSPWKELSSKRLTAWLP